MCGRTACTLGPNDLVVRCTKSLPKTSKKRPPKWVDNKHDGHVYTTSYNKAPGSVCPVLVAGEHLPKSAREGTDEIIDKEEICVFPMLWGLVPAWHEGHPQKTGLSTSNCRSEGMFEKKMFSECLQRRRRCVVLVDGFYEWKTQEVKSGVGKKSTSKQPYFIFHGMSSEESLTAVESADLSRDCKEESVAAVTDRASSAFVDAKSAVTKSEITTSADLTSIESPTSPTDYASSSRPGQLLAMAGLFCVGSPRSGEGRDPKNSLYSYSVITVPSSSTLNWLHVRQPAVLTTEEEILRWLTVGDLGPKEVKELIRPVTTLGFFPVSSLVNNARVNDEQCMAPINLEEEEEKKKPKPNALTNWLVQGSAKSVTGRDPVKTDSGNGHKPEKKENLMSTWLAKGKRKSDAVDDDDEARKKAKHVGPS